MVLSCFNHVKGVIKMKYPGIFLHRALFIILSISNAFSQDSIYVVATITGEKPGDELELVVKVGDVNGDGFDDVFVCSGYGHYTKLYFGGALFDTTADLKFGAENIAGAGDVNSDGFDDILVKTYVDGTIFSKGRILLYLGGSPVDTIPDFEFTEPWIQDALGAAMAGVGDVNGDSYNDFLIGSPYNWSDGTGRAYLFLGGEIISNVPCVTFKSDKNEDFFGDAVCGIGDLNNDEFNDIIIGAPSQNNPEEDSGRVMLYYGSDQMDSLPDKIFQGDDIYFGTELYNAGDINQSGKNSFIISSLSNAYLYLSIDTFITLNITKWGYGGDVQAGTGGDINDDEYNDFILGNDNYTNEFNEMVGISHVFFGGVYWDTFPDLTIIGSTHWGQFSKSMSIIGDINNDGYDEFAIAEPRYPDYENPLGKITIYTLNKISAINNRNFFNQYDGSRLHQNYPNPFNLETKIRYSVNSKCRVSIKIYNSNAQKIKTLVNAEQSAGDYEIVWNGRNDGAQLVSSGIYFVQMITSIRRLESQKSYEITKMVLIK
jgi:hypothetical protein